MKQCIKVTNVKRRQGIKISQKAKGGLSGEIFRIAMWIVGIEPTKFGLLVRASFAGREILFTISQE